MQTPQTQHPKLANALGLSDVDLWLKREDKHRYGSHKGRSIPLMIKTYAKQGFREFVISSSGNAALASIHSVIAHNSNNPDNKVSLRIFVGMNIDKKKLALLQWEAGDGKREAGISIDQVERPKQSAFQFEKERPTKVKFLRQSTDDLALGGYASLADELANIPNLSAIFVPTSSGTTAQALGQTFLSKHGQVQIHIVQTNAIHPIAECIQPSLLNKKKFHDEYSLASAIVDKVAHRKQSVKEIIESSGGAGWIISNDEIQEVLTITKQTLRFPVSPNSALSLAGLKKAIESGWKPTGSVVCLLTGL